MQQFIYNAANSLRLFARRPQRPWFPNEPSRIGLLLERLRSPARRDFDSLSQALYARPTRDCEQQIAVVMREPVEVVRYLLARNRRHNSDFEGRRNIVGLPRQVRSYCESFRIQQRQDYLHLIRNDNRSRVVASFHFGDFLYGAASLFSLDGASRKNLVLSLNRSAGASYANLTSGFGPEAPGCESELLLHQSDSARLSQLLRADDTSLLLFCDVPPGLNETVHVRFLNRPASFSIGPALLALANRVPLLPLINYHDGQYNHVRLGRQIEPLLGESESLRGGARRVTQELLSFFEGFFLESPQQWRFLPLLPLYFSKPSRS